MRFGRLLEGFLGRKPTDTGQETPEGIRTQIAAINTDIEGLKGFQHTADSTGPSRATDARRREELQRLKAQLEAKLPPQPEPVGVSESTPVAPGVNRQPEVVEGTRTPQENEGTT